MPHSRTTVAAVRWNAVFPWLIIVRAVRVAFMARVILLAIVGVAATQAGWSVIDRVTLRDDAASQLWRLTDELREPHAGAAVTLDQRGDLAMQVDSLGGPLARGWAWAMQSFAALTRHDGGVGRWFGLMLSGLWAIAVWSLAGGAIARIAALYLTRGESIGPIAALASAVPRWTATAGAPILTLVAIALVALPLVFAGWLVRLDLLALVIGVLWFAILLGGVALALLAIGLALGWPLMWSTIAVERTDAFDGISRGYAYVYQRPLHLFFFVLVAAALGLLAQAAIDLIVDASLDATRWAVSGGAGQVRTAALLDASASAADSTHLSGAGDLASKAMRFWTGAFSQVAAAFPMAYLFSAAMAIYLLMRRLIDSADMGDVTFDEGEPQRGLPALADDPATGVPHVVGAAGDATAPPITPAS